MKQRFEKAVIETTDLQALLALGLLLCLRAWRAIPKLRPIHLILPATITQVVFLGIAVFNIHKLFFIYSIGIFVLIAVFMFPMLRQQSKPSAHWVR